MKKTLLIAGALLALTASMASAQGGMNLSWTDCGTFGLAQKNFACNSNTGAPQILIVSAVTPAPMDQLNSEEAVIDLQTNAAVLSDWWNLGTGGCRVASFSGNATFSSGPFNCTDPWGGNAAGGVNYTYGFGAPNRARIRGVFAVPGTVTSDGASEYYMEQVIINNAKTTGTGSCAGCTDGACIVLNSVKVTQPATVHQDYTITNPLGRAYVLWQAGGANPGSGPNGTGCPGATPTRNETWGSVKSLYR